MAVKFSDSDSDAPPPPPPSEYDVMTQLRSASSATVFGVLFWPFGGSTKWMYTFVGLPATAELKISGDALSIVRDTCRSDMVGRSRCRFSWPDPTCTFSDRAVLNETESRAIQSL